MSVFPYFEGQVGLISRLMLGMTRARVTIWTIGIISYLLSAPSLACSMPMRSHEGVGCCDISGK